MEIRQAWVGLGSNLGDRASHLGSAIAHLQAHFPDEFRASSLYETAPVGAPGQEPYLNQVATFQTDWEGGRLLYLFKGIEVLLGRRRRVRWDSREIDVDLLALGEMVVEEGRLHLPHPGLVERPFVLVPLQELQPEWRHPISGHSPAELLGQLHQAPGAILRRWENVE